MRVKEPIPYLAALMSLGMTGKYTIQPAEETEKPGTLVIYLINGEIKRITGTYKESLDILLEWGDVNVTKGKLSEKDMENLRNASPVEPDGLLKAILDRLNQVRDKSTSTPMIVSTIKGILKRMKAHTQISSKDVKTLYDVLEQLEKRPAILLINMGDEQIIGFIDGDEEIFMNIIGKLEKEEVQKKSFLKEAKYWIFHPAENLYRVLKGFATEGVVVNGKILIKRERELQALIEDYSIISFFDAKSRKDIREPLVICIFNRCTDDLKGLLEKEVEYVAWAGD